MGVIDLLDGFAVHAIAGNREAYRPVPFCEGDPLRLATHYLSAGVSAFYVADLTSIRQRAPQIELIQSIAELGVEVWLDLGWAGREHGSPSRLREGVEWLKRSSNVHFIAATESCQEVDALTELADCVGPHRTHLGLDYRDGELLGVAASEAMWIQAAMECKIIGCVILDLAAVGTGQGPRTVSICQRIKEIAPDLALLSGGGVRSPEDAKQLQASGCDHVLVATALYP